NFAWVVPLPSAPKIEAVSTNFFSYLNLSFQPRLITDVGSWWILFGLIWFVAATGIRIYRHKGGAGRMMWWLGFILLVLVLVTMMLPPMGVVGRGAKVAAPNSVEVLNRQSVGVYNVTTLTGKGSSALVDWLNNNGFPTPKSALPAISNYVAQGWVFV